MYSNNENSFWKSKSPHLPGCIKPLNSDDRFLRKLSLLKETKVAVPATCAPTDPTPPIELPLGTVKQTALEVIKKHNQIHGLKNIHHIELALTDNANVGLVTAPVEVTRDSSLENTKDKKYSEKPPKLQNGESHSATAPILHHHSKDPTPATTTSNSSTITATITATTATITTTATTTIISSHKHITNDLHSDIAATKATTTTTTIPPLETSPSPPTSPQIHDSLPLTTSESSQTTSSLNASSPSPTTPSAPSIFPLSSFPGRSIRSHRHKTQQPCTHTNTTLSSSKIPSYLLSDHIQLAELKTMCWSGIPHQCRSLAWKLLCSYMPLQPSKRQATLGRKREEYNHMVDKYYNDLSCRKNHQEAYHQIHIDVPRMSPCIPIFQQTLVQELFERILFTWAIRHPASGYVQGMNDLLIPFFVVFLTPFIPEGQDLRNFSVASLSAEVVAEVEADSFWCFSRLMEGIQDNYTFAQPGIQKQVIQLKDLMSRINNTLHQHLLNNHIEYLQFAFRWVNNLLMRELSLPSCIRLWDTYLCEPDVLASFHLYVCATLLHTFSSELLAEHDFQGLMLLLKNLPTHNWTDLQVSMLLAEAYRLKYAFADAPKHLTDV